MSLTILHSSSTQLVSSMNFANNNSYLSIYLIDHLGHLLTPYSGSDYESHSPLSSRYPEKSTFLRATSFPFFYE